MKNKEIERGRAMLVAEQINEIYENRMNVLAELRETARCIEMYGEFGKSERGRLGAVIAECRVIADETEKLLKGVANAF